MKPIEILAVVFGFLWLLVRVVVGATDLREEMHRLGLD